MKNKQVTMTALLLASAILVAGCGEKPTATPDSTAENQTGNVQETEETAMEGSTFSQMETTDLDGNTIDSSIFADRKITLVNSWNVGCTPCVNELPELNKVNEEYADQGAAVIGLYNDLGMGISEDEMNQIKEILNQAGAGYTQIKVDGTLASDDTILNMMVFPTTYVVDSNGTILETIEGSNDYEGWKGVIESYLSEAE